MQSKWNSCVDTGESVVPIAVNNNETLAYRGVNLFEIVFFRHNYFSLECPFKFLFKTDIHLL